MERNETTRDRPCAAPWTVAMTAALLVLNGGVFPFSPPPGSEVLASLEYDRTLVLGGEVWRLLTGNLVHWSVGHLALDAAAFLVVGLLLEPVQGPRYPAVLLGSALAVGFALLAFLPGITVYRGLSGVATGQFAAAVLEGLRRSRHWRESVLLLGAGALLLFKLVHESATGVMMFAAATHAEIGQPVPLAHVAGAIGALAISLRHTPHATGRQAALHNRDRRRWDLHRTRETPAGEERRLP